MATKKNSKQIHAYRAGFILPMTTDYPIIQDGLLIKNNSHIAEIGLFKELKRVYSGEITDLGPGTMVPGLLNAHTHLELSHLYGRTQLGQGFEAWVKSLVQLPLKKISKPLLLKTIKELQRYCTACIGDISGHNPRLLAKVLSESELCYKLFIEFFGFKPPKGQRLIWPRGISPRKSDSLAASGHALYSTHPTTLQLVKSWSVKNHQPFVMHLAEHPGEFEFLTTGRGTFADLIKNRLVPDNFVPPEMSPVAYADRLGLLDEHSMAIHCVQVNNQDIHILTNRNANICLCPRSNHAIGVGRAPWEKLHAAGLNLCLGTDSLASAPDLNLWQEAYYLASNWQTELSLPELISFLTVNPAQALGVSSCLGSLEPGKLACFSFIPDKLTAIIK